MRFFKKTVHFRKVLKRTIIPGETRKKHLLVDLSFLAFSQYAVH
jgi:hypothetical protein